MAKTMGGKNRPTEDPQETLEAVARGDRPVLETIIQGHIDTFERSGLDRETYMLVRIAALVALDAPPVSYLVNLGVAKEMGITLEQVRGILVALAPLVGSARIVSATGQMIRAFAMAEAEREEEEEETGSRR